MSVEAPAEVHRLAEFLVGITVDRMPASALERAKFLILDTIACSIAGAVLPAARLAAESWNSVNGSPEATVFPSPARRPAFVAAYLNAHQANLLDFDDTYFDTFGGHPGATIVPVALAVAEREGASGLRLLAGVVAGYEAALRIGRAIGSGFQGSRMESRAWQVFGSTTAAAVIQGLSPSQLVQAFGLAGMNAPAAFMVKFHDPSGSIGWVKNNSGWIALGGLLAADFTCHGMRGNPWFLDAEGSRVLGGHGWDPGRLLEGVGCDWQVLLVSIKRFSACYYIQTTLEAIEHLKSTRSLALEAIERVEVALVSSLAADRFSFLPRSSMDIPFSIPFLVALSLSGIPTGSAWQGPAVLEEPALMAAARRVTVVNRPKLTLEEAETASTVTVFLKDGAQVRATVSDPRGSPRRPLSWSEVQEKSRQLVAPVAGIQAVERLAAAIANSEHIPVVRASSWMERDANIEARG